MLWCHKKVKMKKRNQHWKSTSKNNHLMMRMTSVEAIYQTFQQTPSLTNQNWTKKNDNLPAEPMNTSPLNPLSSSTNVIPTPAQKCHKLDVPAHEAQKITRRTHHGILEAGLCDIGKLIESKKTQFAAGAHGLQAYHACSFQSCLQMVVNNKHHLIDASKRAADCQGFAEKWGRRMVCQWIASWLNTQELPESNHGCHSKVYLVLDDLEMANKL